MFHKGFPLFCISVVISLAAVMNLLAADGDAEPIFLTGAGFSAETLDISLEQNGKLIVVGKFTSIVGVPYNRVARLDVNGNLDITFNSGGAGANGDVNVVKILPDGKILIGGSFSNYNGVVINGLARLNADGSLDTSFNAGLNFGGVNSITLVSGSQILIAGGFTSVNGTARRLVARLSYDGAVDQSFNPPVFEYNPGGIRGLALQPDGKMVIVGDFWDGNTGLNINIARLNTNGSIDTSFPARTNSPASPPVSVVAVRPDGKILIAGKFSSVNGTPKGVIALLNSNGTLDTSFNPTDINKVTKIDFQSDGKIVLAGDFPNPGFGTGLGIKRLNANGTNDSSFVPVDYTPINTFVFTPDNRIIAGGLIMTPPLNLIPGANPAGVRRINADGSRDASYLTRTGATSVSASPIDLFEQTDGRLILHIGGTTNGTVGGFVRSGFARLNADGMVDESYNPDVRGTAAASLPDNSVIVGGISTPDTGSTGRYTIRKINPDGTIDAAFAVDTIGPQPGTSIGQNVDDIEPQPDGKFIVAGEFTTIGGVARKGIARLNADGSVDETFATNVIGDMTMAGVKKVALLPDGKMWISVFFQTSSTSGSTGVYRLNANGIAETFTGVGQIVYDLAPVNDGKVYISGTFITVSGAPINQVARLNQDGTLDTSFTPPLFGNGVSSVWIATILAQPNGKLLVGGDFSVVAGTTRRGIARLNLNGSLDTTFNALLNVNQGAAFVNSVIKQSDGRYLLGGQMSSASTFPRNGVARLKPLFKPAVFDFDGDGKTDISIFRPSLGEWWYLKSSNGGNYAAQFGNSSDKSTPADFTGDGKSDIALFRPSTGEWFVLRSEDASYYSYPFGTKGDIPFVGDFDADGKSDSGVFRPSNSTWYIRRSSDGGATIQQFGQTGDVPVVADYDGDGKSDIAIYRVSAGEWWIQRSSAGIIAFQFGSSTDKPVQGDYTGDGKADVALFRPVTGEWFVLRSENQSYYSFPFGTNGDIPAPGDYDGDGKFDATVFRPSSSTWYSQRTTAGTLIQSFGQSGDTPVPHSFVP